MKQLLQKFTCLIIMNFVLTTNSFGTELIKVFENDEKYFIIPTKTINSFEVNKSDKELTIYFDYNHVNSYPHKAEIENISEKEALSLIKKIFETGGSKIMDVKVNDMD